MVFICGSASAIFVVCANAWMNSPAGFTLENGVVTQFDPWQAMWNPASASQTMHMLLAAYVAVAFGAAGVHAWKLLKEPGSEFHKKALQIAFWVGVVSLPLQLLSGHSGAEHVAKYQPIKLAAMEGQWETHAGAPLRIFGWPDQEHQKTEYAIEIPYMLSLLAYEDPHAVVRGLKSFPKEDLPPVWPIHLSFQVMVFSGLAMFGAGVLGVILLYRRRGEFWSPKFLKLMVACSPLGFIAVEAGWMVTEIGRQPWIIYGVMRTAEAVTPMPHLVVPFIGFSVLYFFLGLVVIYLLQKRVFHVDA